MKRTEEFIIDENGDRWCVLRNSKGVVISTSAANDQKVIDAHLAAEELRKQQELTIKTEKMALLRIDPQTATNEDITRLLQFVVRKLV